MPTTFSESEWTTEPIKTETASIGYDKPVEGSSESTVNIDVVSDIMINDETSTGTVYLKVYIMTCKVLWYQLCAHDTCSWNTMQ